MKGLQEHMDNRTHGVLIKDTWKITRWRVEMGDRGKGKKLYLNNNKFF